MLDLGISEQSWAVAHLLSPKLDEYFNWPDRLYPWVRIQPWYNCRETGFVFQLLTQDKGVLNIAVFEHRNSDELCAWRWKSEYPKDQPTTDDVPDEVAPDKYTHSFKCGYGEIGSMAEYVMKEFERFAPIEEEK